MNARTSSYRALPFILFTIFIDSVGIGILIPVIPDLIRELAAVDISQAAVYGGAITALFSFVQFFSSPILGNLSDAFGRRPVILLSLTAFGFSYVLMGLAPSLVWLFIAQALAGFFGGTHAAAAAYIADITDPEKRARPFGMMGAAFGLGFMVGPVLSGIIAEWGLRLPFYTAALLALLNVCYGYWALPESLEVDNRRKFKLSRSSPWGAFKHLQQYRGIPILLLVLLLSQFGLQAVTVTWAYFTSFQFEWSPKEIGFSLGMYGIVSVITQGVILGWLADRIGDGKTALVGLFLMCFGLLGFSVVENSWIGIIFIVPCGMAFMTQGALRSFISKELPVNEQGTVQGALLGVNSLAAIVTPLLMPWIFSVFTSGQAGIIFPGAPYLVGAAFSAVGILILYRHVR